MVAVINCDSAVGSFFRHGSFELPVLGVRAVDRRAGRSRRFELAIWVQGVSVGAWKIIIQQILMSRFGAWNANGVINLVNTGQSKANCFLMT